MLDDFDRFAALTNHLSTLVECPVCLAPAGTRCDTGDGAPHLGRVVAADTWKVSDEA